LLASAVGLVIPGVAIPGVAMAGGESDVLAPGGFDAVTITKAITLCVSMGKGGAPTELRSTAG
jgi:hypothetical protein